MYRDVKFRSDRNDCAGRLYIPGKNSNGAAIVMAHGFSGTMDCRLFDYGARFREAGFHVLVFDYRGFGKSEGEPRQFVSVPKQKRDWQHAIDYVRALDAVDADRIGLWGYSFSGGHVIHLAVDDPNIRAIVAQCPLIDAFAALTKGAQFRDEGAMKKIESLALRDWWGGLVGRRPIFINAGPDPDQPEQVSILAAPEALQFADIAGPNWINAVAARSLISGKFTQNNPIGIVDRLKTPTLIQVGDSDQTVCNEAIATFARRAGPCVRSLHYPYGHFSIAIPPAFEGVVADATAFFTEHLVV